MIRLPVFAAILMVQGMWTAGAWDYEGHRLINQLALASLPTNFPAFVQTGENQERIGFLAGEPDRWRNTADLALKHCNGPDHYIDLEELPEYGLDPHKLPVFRYDFISSLALYRAAHADKFPPVDPLKNEDHTRQLVGLVPWSLTEQYGKVKSGFAYLKEYEAAGLPEEITNAQANVVYVMGVMGHMAGDSAQPLHTTIHHHGWVGANPANYSTNGRIHSWIDGGYFAKIGGLSLPDLRKRIRPARLVMIGDRPAKPAEVFQVVVQFLIEQNREVEPLYLLEKQGKLSGNGTVGLEGQAFLEGQIIKGAQLLGDLWYSAWQQATPDTFLKNQLNKRASTKNPK
jgi:hypothetical protein